MADAPFHAPPDIILDLPPPISVNETRKIDWTAHRRLGEWKRKADAFVLEAKRRKINPLKLTKIKRFEIWITLSESLVNIDADNAPKHLIDYLRLIELIENDAKKNMRAVHVTWGFAPAGCRVVIKPCEAAQ